MKITLDQELSISMDCELLPMVAGSLTVMLNSYGDRADEAAESLLTVLIFRKMEKDKPGSVNEILEALKSISKS
jgi:hypothetical protein